MDKEIYKQIKGTQYLISNYGNIKKNNVLITPNMSPQGYLRISFGKRWHYIHRLVGEYFLNNDNPSINTEINHIDGNKTNNNSQNLEWTSHYDNTIHAAKNGKMKRNSYKIPVICFNIVDGIIRIFQSEAQANEYVNGDKKARGVSKCITGISKSYKGWNFMKFDEKMKRQLLQDIDLL